MKGKKTLAVMSVLLASVMGASLVACGNNDNKPEEQPKEYTVTFDANTGTLTGNATIKVKAGEKITGAPTAAKAEHTFDAWYDKATGGVKIVLDTYTVTKDVTLYAHYTANGETPPPVGNVKVTFDANGGKFEGDKEKLEKTPDADGLILDLEEPTRENYRFDDWYTAATGGTAADGEFMLEPVTESKTYYAHWIRQYTVTFNANGGTIAGESSLKVDENGKITGAPSASIENNEFYGWYTSAEGGDKVDLAKYEVTGDTTLHAHYGPFTMPLTGLKDKEGEGSKASKLCQYPNGF